MRDAKPSPWPQGFLSFLFFFLSSWSPDSSLQDRNQRLLAALVGLGRRLQSTPAACCVTAHTECHTATDVHSEKKKTTNLKTTSRHQKRLENKPTSNSIWQFPASFNSSPCDEHGQHEFMWTCLLSYPFCVLYIRWLPVAIS